MIRWSMSRPSLTAWRDHTIAGAIRRGHESVLAEGRGRGIAAVRAPAHARASLSSWGGGAGPAIRRRDAGRRGVTVVPAPGALAMTSAPPWISTIDLVSGRPSPVPL